MCSRACQGKKNKRGLWRLNRYLNPLCAMRPKLTADPASRWLLFYFTRAMQSISILIFGNWTPTVVRAGGVTGKNSL